MRNCCWICSAVVMLGLSFLGPAFAADRQFRGEFDPFPHDMSTRDNVVGVGKVSATLVADQLTIRGDFSGLSSFATTAFLRMGVAMGVPGQRIGELTITKGEAGQISGTVKLNAAAITALNHNGLYVELDSAKAPEGNSWAWLEGDQAGMS